MLTDSCGNTGGQRSRVKEAEEELKYKNLCTAVQRMWNMKCVNILVLTGATGIVTKGLKKNLEAKQGKHSVDALPKAATLGTSHIWKLLQSEPGSLSDGDHCWFTKSAKQKGPLTRDYYYYYYHYYYDDDINIKVLIKQTVRQRSCFKAGRMLIYYFVYLENFHDKWYDFFINKFTFCMFISVC
jgi:hypothetical protein